MGYTHFDKVSGETGIGVGVKGSEIVVADSSGNLKQAGTQVIGTVTPSAVITASAAAVKTSVVRFDDIIKTTVFIDLTGLKSSTTDLDIIGDTGVSYIMQVTAAINGTIYAGQIGCSEVPTTGADDIDLYAATEGTGAYDGGIAALAETALVTAGAAHAIGTVKPFTALPAANQYLYLTSGEAGTAGTYDAGQLVIEMWGYA